MKSLLDNIEEILFCAREITQYSKDIDGYSINIQDQIWQCQLIILTYSKCECIGGRHMCGLENIMRHLDNLKMYTQFSDKDGEDGG